MRTLSVLMVFGGLFLISVSSFATTIDQISSGARHTCALSNKTVTCWGDNQMGQLDIPALKNPTQISSGYYHSCALTDDGVKCWGGDIEGLKSVVNVPIGLKNPRMISSGYEFSCALTDDGVKCWGGLNYNRETYVPFLKNPTKISSGGDFSCAATDEGIVCWGDDRDGKLRPPSIPPTQLTEISVGHGVGCAIANKKALRCWGVETYGIMPNDMKSNTSSLSVGGLACGLMQGPARVKCFSVWKIEHNETTVPPLNNPTQVSSGLAFACAVTDNGVKCWGSNEFGQTDVPTVLTW